MGVGRSFQALGDTKELGEDRMGSPAVQGWGVRQRYELVFGSSPAQGMRLYLHQGMPGDAHHSLTGRVLQPVHVSLPRAAGTQSPLS